MKRYIAVLLPLLLLILAAPPAAAASAEPSAAAPADTWHYDEADDTAEPERFNGASAASAEKFTDVPADAWYCDDVNYVVESRLFRGTSSTTFSPERPITRAEFVTVMANKSGVDPAEYADRSRFSDVSTDSWYAPYVQWAALSGVVTGTEKRLFSPDMVIIREQMAVMLYNYAQKTGNNLPFTTERFYAFPDHGEVSGYAVEAMQWAACHGVITGVDGLLEPKGQTTRAQAAAIFRSADELLTKTGIMTEPVYISAETTVSAGLYAHAAASEAAAVLPAGTRVQMEQTADPLWYLAVLDDAAQEQWDVTGNVWYLYAETLRRVSNGKAAAAAVCEKDIARRLAELQESFPSGKYWNHMGSEISANTQTPYSVTDTPCNHYANSGAYNSAYCNRYFGVTAGAFSHITSMQCLGFASLLGDEIFGEDAPVHSYRDLNQLRVGDHIRYNTGSHSVTVTGIYDTCITVAEVNRDFKTCQIEWGREITYTELNDMAWDITCYTRYPLKYTGTEYTTWE